MSYAAWYSACRGGHVDGFAAVRVDHCALLLGERDAAVHRENGAGDERRVIMKM